MFGMLPESVIRSTCNCMIVFVCGSDFTYCSKFFHIFYRVFVVSYTVAPESIRIVTALKQMIEQVFDEHELRSSDAEQNVTVDLLAYKIIPLARNLDHTSTETVSDYCKRLIARIDVHRKDTHMDLQNLCGHQNYGQVVLATTEWLLSPSWDEEQWESHREGELRNKYWESMTDLVSHVERWDGTEASARRILSILEGRPTLVGIPEPLEVAQQKKQKKRRWF